MSLKNRSRSLIFELNLDFQEVDHWNNMELLASVAIELL